MEYHDENFKPRHLDEYTGDVLDPKSIREAVMEEFSYFSDKRNQDITEIKDVKAIADAVHVRTRWVLCKKNDLVKPDMRAHRVACEVNNTGTEDAKSTDLIFHVCHSASRRFER